ncbi:hypothetical protein BGZ65_001245, partial [Modicella reniformis]
MATYISVMAKEVEDDDDNDGDGDMSQAISELSAHERAVVQKLRRCQEQQRQVYERLASLKHLKHLELG